MIEAFIQYNFLKNAFFSALLASIVCGIIGTVIIEKRLVMMSGGIAHTSFGGIGLGYLLNIRPIIGGIVFAVLASLGLTVINKKTKSDLDALMGMFWAIGMALGVLFITLSPGYPPDLTSYLFGNILSVTILDLRIMAIFDALIISLTGLFFNYWKAYLFDEEFIQVSGIKTEYFDYVLFVMVALSVMVLTKVVGIILAIALLTVPPVTAKLFLNDLKQIILLSIMFGAMICITGLAISYQFNIASGATIILVSGLVYFLAVVIKKRLSL